MSAIKGLILVIMLSISGSAIADTDDGSQFIRVGGNYVVKSVEKRGDNSFVVNFKAEVTSGTFDELQLESDHVHVAVKVGRILRLSAEVLKTNGPTAEISQVVLFFPNVEGHVPVWLMSNKYPASDLKASRYLEMHAPNNDFMIL
jgi:hypothetical protein